MIALIIALWVGVRFVPRLAKNVEWDWLPFLSQYHVTREGWIYFGAVVVVVFAAINTNNNLLYMVLSALLAVLLLSGFLSGVNFRWLNVQMRLPAHCYAGEQFPISLQVQNEKTVFPSFSLSVEQLSANGFDLQSFYITCVPARSHHNQVGAAALQNRGRYQIRKLKILSRYPFGFFLKGKDYALDSECICYPQILSKDELKLAALDILGSSLRFDRGLGNDLYMIRDYAPSDSARHVHWKASAKTGTLKTREFAAEDSRRMTLYLDRYGRPADSRAFERLVSVAASCAFHMIRDGIEISVVTDEWASGFGSTERHLEMVLEYLALVERSNSAGLLPDTPGDASMMLSLRRA
jgi:uncharacterized protein (DUF58 family)